MTRARSWADARQKCSGCFTLLPVAELANNRCGECQPTDGLVRTVGATAKTRHAGRVQARSAQQRQ